jgi:hypothetical protein
MVNYTSRLHRGQGLAWREGAQHWWWGRWLWSEGLFHSFCSLMGEGVEMATVVSIVVREVGVIDGAVVPIVGVPLWQDAVGVVAVNMRSWALTTPVSHPQAVETKPLCRHVCTYHVMWTTPLDDNCRRAVDGT